MHCGELATFAEAVTATLGRRPARKPCVGDSERPHDLALEGSRAVPEPAANWSNFFSRRRGDRGRGGSLVTDWIGLGADKVSTQVRGSVLALVGVRGATLPNM